MFLMLNPSTADETVDDRTIMKCQSFAHRWGYGGISVYNLFAFRATKPADMMKARDPVGPDNDDWIINGLNTSDLVVCAWGPKGIHLGREQQVLDLLWLHHDNVTCLKVTKGGHPSHPLYLPGDLRPTRFPARKWGGK